MDRNGALDAWKKAKPALLLDTGVSEILRKLPNSFTDVMFVNGEAIKSDEPILKQILASLDKQLADKKIKAEKKAFNCIKDIQDAINAAMAKGQTAREDLRKARVELAGYVAQLTEAAREFHKASANLKVTLEGVEAISKSEAVVQHKVGIATARGYYSMPMPSMYQGQYNDITSKLKKLARAMIAIVEDSKSPKPKLDSKTEYQKVWTAYGLEVAKLAKVATGLKEHGKK